MATVARGPIVLQPEAEGKIIMPANVQQSGGRVAFITGANRGIGLETARGLGELGIAVVLGSRDEVKGRTAAETLRAAGIADVEAVRFDVDRPEDHQAIARHLEDRY